MSIFTLSRQMGTLGDPVAAELARRLDAPLLDRTRLLAEPEQYGLPAEQVPLEVAERGPTLLERLGGERPRYVLALRSALYRFAAGHEHAVIVGLGGQVFFAPLRHALRVLLVAPLGVRVERVLAEFGDRAAAEKAVRQHDRERGGYHQYVHHVDWLHPELYHLVVNDAGARVESVAELLLRAAELPDYRPLPESRQALEDLALAAWVEANLSGRVRGSNRLVVRAEQGHMSVSGLVDGEQERQAVERIARGAPGVREVTLDLTVLPSRLPDGV